MYSEDDLLSLSGLQHISFCERQWALIHLEQQWKDNYDTAKGALFHECAHTEGYSCAHGVRAERGLRVWSLELGLFGVADIVEFSTEKGRVGEKIVPVEYKVGKPKNELWDRVQVAAQAMCLEEMHGAHINEGFLFYGKTRRREPVSITDDLRQEVISLSAKMHDLYSQKVTPVAQKTSHCSRCSLQDICLPESFDGSAVAYWEARGEKLESLPC